MGVVRAGSAIDELLYWLAGEENRDFMTLCLQWKKLVGELIADRSFVQRFENGNLHIGVENSVWMQELVLNRVRLLEQLNQLPDIEVKELVFFIRSQKRING